jgi:hypothetical protein
MSDEVSEPVDLIAAHAARKAQGQAALLVKLHGTPTEGATNPARERVEKALVELDAAVAALEGEPEPQPEPVTLLEAAAAAKTERRRALMDALTSRPQPRDESGRFTTTTGLDGGARKTVPPKPETHAETLARVLATGEANVGADL